jgi:acid phosphatase (class A)
MRAAFKKIIAVSFGLLVAGCASPPQPVPEIRPGLLAGYLGKELPDSQALLPAPPVATSAAFRQDEEVSRASQTLRGTPRYALATADANLSFPRAAGVFACALGLPITEQGSPRLYVLLRRVLTDAALATYGAKNKYSRVRPFVHFKEPTCEPKDEEFLRKDGSYPSGHSSIGWAWALVLTELAPERRDALLARGRSFGESRLVCNVHWQSDVIEGRAVGAGAVALLHANPTFKADVDAAKREIEALRAKGEKPGADCPGEAAALAIRVPGVL